MCVGRKNGNSWEVPRLEYRGGGVLNALDCRDGAVLVTSQEAVALVADQVADAQRIHSTAPISFPRAKEKQSEAEDAASSAEEVPAFGTAEFGKLCQELDHRSLGYRVFKRVFDFVFALLAIVVGLIPGALLCIAIAADTKGSPIYSQERIGKRGKPFRIYKFRSMVKDSDNVEKYFTPEQLETWKRERKVENDPRVTKLGRILRSSSLDEIPQFINVLFGQISIIGPRSITRDELEQHFTDGEKALLLSVAPGITGAWQCWSRNEATFENGLRQQTELDYAEGATLGQDLRIFFRTISVMFVKRNGR